mmetsp:Transcript_28479/g.28252  ORF Transcript_28479/g.28252 Transcript_28479/m.28252 type:complete len:95 (+) Transcript_28479:789-1073(+)
MSDSSITKRDLKADLKEYAEMREEHNTDMILIKTYPEGGNSHKQSNNLNVNAICIKVVGDETRDLQFRETFEKSEYTPKEESKYPLEDDCETRP